jgi:hypothetical protein
MKWHLLSFLSFVVSVAACSSSSSGSSSNDGGVDDAGGASDGPAVLRDGGSGATATTDAGVDASVCTTLGAATEIEAEADPSQPPAASGGTIPDGTYRQTRQIYYRRTAPAPTVKFGETVRITGDIFEWASTKSLATAKFGASKSRRTKTPDATHLELTECLCGDCYLGVGMEQPYSVVGNQLWLYERDIDKGGGGDLWISVFESE